MSLCDGFSMYESDCTSSWIYRLRKSYNHIDDEIFRNTRKSLDLPIFDLNGDKSRIWGSWNPNTRVMMFSLSLLRNYEWGAVEYVMRHEIAHQIVSEIFNMDCYGVSHGAAWCEACKIVNIEPERCTSSSYLSQFKGTETSDLVKKIRKILIHANDSGATESESETFMRKAKELMIRHDIDMEELCMDDRVFISRPFGPLFSRWGAYMWSLGQLLYDHYDVKCIRTSGPDGTKRLELFGEPGKLDIAEYVGHALLNQAEILYNAHKAEVALEYALLRKSGKSRCSTRRLSKNAFMLGLIRGYSERLERESANTIDRVSKEVISERSLGVGSKGSRYDSSDGILVPIYNKRLLNELHGKHYQICKCQSAASYGSGYGVGRKKGETLTLSKGVTNSGNKGRLLAM